MIFWTDASTSANNAYLMASHDDLNVLLKRVSRSFYLSMHYLPQSMRGAIGIGYLWARLTDTLADTDAVTTGHRLHMLTALQKTVTDIDWAVSPWASDAEKMATGLVHEGEKQLLMHVHSLQAATCKLDPAQQKMIRRVMNHILDGQRNDLVFFEASEFPVSMNAEQLETYCYQVAGSVGEFWTEVGFHACKNFSKTPRETLRQAGCLYGQGLQLVNILRDFSKDQRLGRCYLPISQQASPQEKIQIYKQWMVTARAYLQKGLWYANQVQPWRTRGCTVLPALLGLKTLDRLEVDPQASMQSPLKISRGQVRKSMLRSVFYPWDPS